MAPRRPREEEEEDPGAAGDEEREDDEEDDDDDDDEEEDDDDDDDDDEGSDIVLDAEIDGETVNIDFEFYDPREEDFHGTRALLDQSPLALAGINTGELSALLVEQAAVGAHMPPASCRARA